MDKVYLFDEYKKDADIRTDNFNNASYIYDELININKTVTSIIELKNSIDSFLAKNEVPSYVLNDLISFKDSLNPDTDLYSAQIALEEYITKYKDYNEKKMDEATDEVEDIKEEVSSDVVKKLEEAGIEVNGNIDEIKENITSYDDINKLESNVDTVAENNYVGNVEVNTSGITDSMDKMGDTGLIQTIQTENNLEVVNNNDISNMVNINNDGSVNILGDNNNLSSNLVALMAMELVVKNNAEMKIVKEENEVNTYKVLIGDFPIRGDSRNFSEMTKNVVNNFNKDISYLDNLSMVAPEMAMALKIVNEGMLNKSGSFKVGINDSKYAFIMDSNYTNISQTFETNGARTYVSSEASNIVLLNNLTPGVNLQILTTTLDGIRKENDLVNSNENVLQNDMRKKLILEPPKPTLNEAAKMSFLLLTGIVVILLIAIIFVSYIYFGG